MLNKASLSCRLKKTTGITHAEASRCADVFIDILAGAIGKKERIELRGFGTFEVREVTSRKSIMGIIPGHKVIVFRPCRKLRDAIWNLQ
ncbi:MAG: HU family DNA-binding protein [Treponema sp.]|jgi:nucleoid DNA-binding protein|nr:HU family DNA-binding protein [Treponema sp.]